MENMEDPQSISEFANVIESDLHAALENGIDPAVLTTVLRGQAENLEDAMEKIDSEEGNSATFDGLA
jgi:hypothetical protein